jgi:isopenicillin N synthase-like dioxygenase
VIDRIDARALFASDPDALARMRRAATETGFAVIGETALTQARVTEVLDQYARFFALPEAEKARIDMALTGANRGWGRAGGEQVNPEANPDLKQVFDCGHEVGADHPHAGKAVYAPNLWPENPPGFRSVIEAYYADACAVAMEVLRALALSLGHPRDSFDDAFAAPMALLRGNYYPPRPDWAGAQDFGIAAHTDYGCLTLLATDGAPGLEVQTRTGEWQALSAPPGDFIINFGEMMEMWTEGRVVATPHRVIGGAQERLSIPLFFNPSFEANVSPPGASQPILAGPYLAKRFAETYRHLQAR